MSGVRRTCWHHRIAPGDHRLEWLCAAASVRISRRGRCGVGLDDSRSRHPLGCQPTRRSPIGSSGHSAAIPWTPVMYGLAMSWSVRHVSSHGRVSPSRPDHISSPHLEARIGTAQLAKTDSMRPPNRTTSVAVRAPSAPDDKPSTPRGGVA